MQKQDYLATIWNGIGKKATKACFVCFTSKFLSHIEEISTNYVLRHSIQGPMKSGKPKFHRLNVVLFVRKVCM